MRAGLSVHSFGITLILAGLHTFALVSANDLVDKRSPPPQARNVFFPRQASASAVDSSPAAAVSSATPADSSSQPAPSTSNTPAASSTPQQQPAQTSTTQQTSAAQQQSNTQAPAGQTSTSSTNAGAAAPSTPTSSFTSAVVTTNQAGQVVTSIVVVAETPPASTAAPSQTSPASGSSGGGGGSSGISSSTIIGLSVAGGVAVLCIVAFFVWKVTRKRLGNYDNSACSPLLLPKPQTFPPSLASLRSRLVFDFLFNPTDIVTQMRKLSGQNSTPTTLPSPCQQTARVEPASILLQKRGEVRLDTHRRPRPTRLRNFTQTHTQSRPCRTSTLTNPTTTTQARSSTIHTVARSRSRSIKLAARQARRSR